MWFIIACLLPAVSNIAIDLAYSAVIGLLGKLLFAWIGQKAGYAALFILIPAVLLFLRVKTLVTYIRCIKPVNRFTGVWKTPGYSCRSYAKQAMDEYVSLWIHDLDSYSEESFDVLERMIENSVTAIAAAVCILIIEWRLLPAIMVPAVLVLGVGMLLKRFSGRVSYAVSDGMENMGKIGARGRFCMSLQKLIFGWFTALFTILGILYTAMGIIDGILSLGCAAFLVLLVNELAKNVSALFTENDSDVVRSLLKKTDAEPDAELQEELKEELKEELQEELREGLRKELQEGSREELQEELGEMLQERFREGTDGIWNGTAGEDKHFSFQYDILCLRLTFSFGEKVLYRPFDLCLVYGNKYMLIGKTGTGKTTLVNLLTGMYKNYGGQILYDDVELRNIPEKELSEGTAMIRRDISLFNDTIYHNICMDTGCSEEEAVHAVEMAGLSVLIEHLPQGIHTQLTDHGNELPAGALQSIAIARALIRRHRLIVADDILLGLPEKVARKIENTLLELDMTVIVVSEREHLGGNKNYDGIIKITPGKVVCLSCIGKE